ncbi:MAG: flavin reductase family protein [Acidobacteria bacterium]|nr:flavin reductase family protein [Acidobacteriota bacterium]
MDVRPQEMAPREFYRLLITSVVPRPIAWVSSISKEGIHNLAPFSFFNALCATPPLLGFCPGIRSQELREARGTGVKDTLRNVRETGEFVVNMVPFALAEQMNLTAGEYEATVDEFEVAKLRMRPSQMIRPPQVAESPVSFECKVFQILDFGTETAGGSLVIGEILSVHLAEEVLRNGRIDGQRLDLVGRMGGSEYTRTRERFEMERPGLNPPGK